MPADKANIGHYRAFLSYSRKDYKIATWLHKKIDTYKIPKQLFGTTGRHGDIPESLHPIFIDRADLPGGGRLNDHINETLLKSDSLIVLCSPAASKSFWVNEEVKRFINLGRGDRIYPVITPDSPSSEDIEQEFYPPELRDHDYLAVDLREILDPHGKKIGDGRTVGLMKLTAGLLGVDQDVIIGRERTRQKKLFAGLYSSAILFLIVAILAIWFGYQSHLKSIDAIKFARVQTNLRGIAESRSESLTNAVSFYRNIIKEQADSALAIKMGYLIHVAEISFTTCADQQCRVMNPEEMDEISKEYFMTIRQSIADQIKFNNPCFGACRFKCDADYFPFYILTQNEQECAIADIADAASHVHSINVYRAKAETKEVIGIQISSSYWGRNFGGTAFPMVFLARDLKYEGAKFSVIGNLMYVGFRTNELSEEDDYRISPDVSVKWLRNKELPDILVGETWGYPGSYKEYTSMYYGYINEFSRYAGYCLAQGIYDVGVVGKNEDGLINLINADLKDCSKENEMFKLRNPKSENLHRNAEDPEEDTDEDEAMQPDEA